MSILKLIKNFFIEKDEPKSTDIILRGLNRNGEEYSVTIPTLKIERDNYHTEPCFIRAGGKNGANYNNKKRTYRYSYY